MPLDKEKAGKNLKDILDRMNDTDTALLHEYYKLYKKEVSFFRRSWAAAWLFMYYDNKETPTQRAIVEKKKIKLIKDVPTQNLVSIPEEESKRLFISIGKNRRLFPREVITLIMSKTETPREDIGLIRILDNYSFVQVRDTRADGIIEALNGHRFRGRTLAVNFAKLKSGESESD